MLLKLIIMRTSIISLGLNLKIHDYSETSRSRGFLPRRKLLKQEVVEKFAACFENRKYLPFPPLARRNLETNSAQAKLLMIYLCLMLVFLVGEALLRH